MPFHQTNLEGFVNSCEKYLSPSIFFQLSIFSARSSLAEQTTPVSWTWKRWWKMIGQEVFWKNPEEKDSSVVSPKDIYTTEKLRWIKNMLVWKKVLKKVFLFKYGYLLVSIRQISRVLCAKKCQIWEDDWFSKRFFSCQMRHSPLIEGGVESFEFIQSSPPNSSKPVRSWIAFVGVKEYFVLWANATEGIWRAAVHVILACFGTFFCGLFRVPESEILKFENPPSHVNGSSF